MEAIKKFDSGRAAGYDSIKPGMLKVMGENDISYLLTFLKKIYEKQK